MNIKRLCGKSIEWAVIGILGLEANVAVGQAQFAFQRDTQLWAQESARSELCVIPAGSSFEVFSHRSNAQGDVKLFANRLPTECGSFKSGWLVGTNANYTITEQSQPTPQPSPVLPPLPPPSNPPVVVPPPAEVQGPIKGVWISHLWLASERSMREVITNARRAGLNTLYPVVSRYSCAYFKTDSMPYCDSQGDVFGRFLQLTRQLAPGMRVVPWFERSLQVKYAFANENPDMIEAISIDESFPTLNLDRSDVRQMIFTALSDVMAYPGVDRVHVDDGIEYLSEARIFASQANAYKQKLDRFVLAMIADFKRNHPGKIFEMSHLPQPFAENAYLAAWQNWPVDRMIIQCYRSTAEAILKSQECFQAPRGFRGQLTGIGIAGFANGRLLSNDEIITVMRHQLSRGDDFILFEAAQLINNDELLDALRTVR